MRRLILLSRPVRLSAHPLRAHLPSPTTTSMLHLRPRPFSSTPSTLSPDENPHQQREAQEDREAMNPEPNEVSKSGTDSSSAAQEEAAFDTDSPDPQDAKDKAGKGNEVNPLEASPANPEISQGTSETEGGVDKKGGEGGGGRGLDKGGESV